MNALIDPCQHGPGLTYAIDLLSLHSDGKCEYWSDPERIGKVPYLYGYYTKQDIKSLYNISSKSLSEEQPDTEYSNLFVMIPLGDILMDGQTDLCLNYYTNVLNRFDYGNSLVIIDNSDYCTTNDKFIEQLGIRPTLILKKSMSEKLTYSKLYKPFPYVQIGKYDLLYYLNKESINNYKNSNKVFWAGSSVREYRRDTGETCDRPQWLQDLEPFLDISDSNTPIHPIFGSYDIPCSSHKYSLYLRGRNDVTRRLFEIMRCNSLILLERSPAILPEGIKFSDLCYFSSKEEFFHNYYELETHKDLYHGCLDRQNTIRKDFFSYEYIANYISSMI